MLNDEFIVRLDEQPYDWHTRLVYADWLEERGEAILANGQRWMVANQKFTKEPRFEWWSEKQWDLDNHDVLPHGIYKRLHSYDGKFWIRFENRVEAETSLAKSLHQLGIISSCNSV